MAEKDQTLIFIPDISGFTDFVNSTAIEHSRHIITELLEIIINSDILEMNVSEIEGDAILFYSFEHLPSPAAIISQAKKNVYCLSRASSTV